MTGKRKIVLLVVLGIVAAGHIALFRAAGVYRRLAEVLIIVDVLSLWFVAGAVREFKKLDDKKNPPFRTSMESAPKSDRTTGSASR